MNLKLSAPKETTWVVAVVVGIVGILMELDVFSLGGIVAWWLIAIGFALLAIASLVKGL